jgi:hypothetical protein
VSTSTGAASFVNLEEKLWARQTADPNAFASIVTSGASQKVNERPRAAEERRGATVQTFVRLRIEPSPF